METRVKITILILLLWISCVSIYAQHRTEFRLEDFPKGELLSTMEKNIQTVVDIINSAYSQDLDVADLKFPQECVSDSTVMSLKRMWKSRKFRCLDTSVETSVLSKPWKEYQIRNIRMEFDKKDINGEKYGEFKADFDGNGRIIALELCLDYEMYKRIVSGELSEEVCDQEVLMRIADVIEKLQSAYNTKDMSFLQKIYSDDALIITGTTYTIKKDGKPYSYTEYETKDKKDYLEKLAGVFERNEWINIDLDTDNLDIYEHKKKKGIYGVGLIQKWNSSGGYRDEGRLFLVFDFTDKSRPEIWVRVWEDIDAEYHKELSDFI